MEKRQEPDVVVQYVYETAAKTFDGPVGGYMTVNPPPAESTPDSSFSNSNANSNNNLNSNSNSNSDSNSNSNSDSQEEDQQAAQMVAAAAAASSSAVAEEIAKASSKAIAAAKASMELAAAAKQTQQVEEPTKEAVQSAPAAEKTTAAVKATPTIATSKSTLTPVVVPTTSASPTVASTPTSSFIDASQAAISSQPTDNAGSSRESSGGMSGGAKAGLAIGILLIIALVAGGIFFCYRRKKKQENEAYGKADDEKSAYPAGLARAQSTVSTRTTATAPRLSLRPVTQFLPDLAARGKAANAAGAGATGASRDHNDPANPFGNHAEVARPSEPSYESEKTALPIQANAPQDPFADTEGAAPPNTDRSVAPAADIPAPLRVRTPTPEASVAAGAIGAGAGVIAGAKAAGRSNAPKPLNLPVNRSVSPVGASPTVSEFSHTSASPGAMANGPPPSNVHRIQLDFKPSMEDELSLRAGQLVRLLHEYDDGWVRIDIFLAGDLMLMKYIRLSASVLTVHNKVLLPVLVSQLAPSSPVHHPVPAGLVGLVLVAPQQA